MYPPSIIKNPAVVRFPVVAGVKPAVGRRIVTI